MGRAASSPTDKLSPSPPSVLSSSGENGGLWENSKKSVFSKRPLPLFPCISIHSLHGPTINPLVFLFFPTVPSCVLWKREITGHLRSKKKRGGRGGRGTRDGVKLKDWIQGEKKLLVQLV